MPFTYDLSYYYFEEITKMSVDQTCFQICHAPASLERHIMRGLRPSSTGCVLRAKPIKNGHVATGCVLQAHTWPRDASFKHGMRPSSTRCVLQVSEASDKISGELQVSEDFSGELFSTILLYSF
ncbi:hypothetical protein Hanom_Chr08g00750841 [Helianthus anomalus]